MSLQAFRVTFTATLWQHPGEGGWHFITLPLDVADELRVVAVPRSFGSIKVTAGVGDETWSTSVFPDRASGSYLLPVKRALRERLGISDGDDVQVTLAPVLAGP